MPLKDEVREVILSTVLKYMTYNVRRYCRYPPPGWTDEDVHQEALTWALQRVDKYKPGSPMSPKSYGVTLCHWGVVTTLDRFSGRSVRAIAARRQVGKARAWLGKTYEREVSWAEAAAWLELDEHTKVSAHPQRTAQLDVEFTELRVSPCPEKTVLISMDSEVVRAAMLELPDRDRLVVERSYLHGETLRSISADLGISKARVGQLRNRGVRRLRQMLLGDLEL